MCNRGLATVALAVTVLNACAPSTHRTAKFNQAEYDTLWTEGDSVIAGAAMTTINGKFFTAEGCQVILNPVTSYTREFYTRCILAGQQLGPADERALRYVKTVDAGPGGQFRFENVPPGRYFIYAFIPFQPPELHGETRYMPVSREISVYSGHDTQVDLVSNGNPDPLWRRY